MLRSVNKIRLIIDLDETTVDFLSYLCVQYNYLYNKNIKREDINKWDLTEFVGVEGKNIFKKPGFFINLKPFPYAIETLLRLKHDGHDIIVATHPPNGVTAMEKVLWVEKYLSFIPQENIVLIARKSLIKGDLIFDDATIHLEGFDGIKVCMDRLYNKDANCDYRVSDWLEFYEVVRNLS